jgi:hypothetical protein
MTPKSHIEINTRTNEYRGLAATQFQRKQERQQALEWVSHNALSTVRDTWRKAKLS